MLILLLNSQARHGQEGVDYGVIYPVYSRAPITSSSTTFSGELPLTINHQLLILILFQILTHQVIILLLLLILSHLLCLAIPLGYIYILSLLLLYSIKHSTGRAL